MTTQQEFIEAATRAANVLKPGDRIRVTTHQGTKRWVTFAKMDRNAVVSKGGYSYPATTIDRLNKGPVDFTREQP